MNSEQRVDLIARLKTQFDKETLENALQDFEAHGCSFYLSELSILLQGRGAQQIWPKIEQRLERDFSLCASSNLNYFLNATEIVELVNRSGITDETIIQDVKDGRRPRIGVLPRERRERIYNELMDIVKSAGDGDFAQNILLFLFEIEPQNSNRDTDKQLVNVATEWCLRFSDEVKVRSVLSKLLWRRPSDAIVRIAGEHFFKSGGTDEITFLLVGLLEATRKRFDERWLDYWFEQSKDWSYVGWITSAWILTTNASREAVDFGKFVVSSGCPDRFHVIRIMAHYFPRRKSFHRWLKRYVKSHIKTGSVKSDLRQILGDIPTPDYQSLAKEALDTENIDEMHDILLELLKQTEDDDIVELAKREVSRYPNAPDSFLLMCEIAKSDPGTAVPWLFEWIETALPDQVCDGLLAIISASPTLENLQKARDWLSICNESRFTVLTWKQARLLEKLAVIDPCEEIIDLASSFLQRAGKSHSSLRRLAKRLKMLIG